VPPGYRYLQSSVHAVVTKGCVRSIVYSFAGVEDHPDVVVEHDPYKSCEQSLD